MSEEKLEFLERSREFWNPGKTQDWQNMEVDLVIDRREGYYIYDMDGRRLIDVHLNGGTFNIGHRNPELIEVLKAATERFDIGNHHFPALARTALAEALALSAPGRLKRTIYAASGSEATDVAIKSARHATGRKKMVSIIKAYHGCTGLAVMTGDDRFTSLFLFDDVGNNFIHVPFNDLEAMEVALKRRDVAAVIMETIPATYGFPMPHEGYLTGVKALCERYGSLYIADEVQTGLMRTGELWGIQRYGVEPDILITGKGISGGIYPIACVLVTEEAGAWMKEDGFGHISSFGGAELGCVVAMKVLEIVQRPEVRKMVSHIGAYIRSGLEQIRAIYPDFLVGIRQSGIVMGLEFGHPEGAKFVMKHLYRNGVWAIFSTLDPRVLQLKPGLLLSQDICEDLLLRLETGVGLAQQEIKGVNTRRSAR